MAQEVLKCLRLEEWVRKRPDTFLGSMSKKAELRWVAGWRDELASLPATLPIKTLSSRDITRLSKEQVNVYRKDEDASDLNPVHDGPFSEGADDDDEDMDEPVSVADKPSTSKLRENKTLKSAGAARILLEYCPAAEKIVDEILQNAADRTGKDEKMKRIDVFIDEERGLIRVKNDGYGMPVTKPDLEENPGAPDEYWPTILFTRIMAGGNFVEMEDVQHHQGGRNGIGGKASNICSKHFRVTVGDFTNGLWFQQQWSDGMTKTTGPEIKPFKAKTGYVEIEFEPDMKFFGDKRPGFSPEFAALIRSRVWELAGVTPDRIGVWLNGVKLPVKNLSHFIGLFHEDSVRPARATVSHKKSLVWDMTVLPASDQLPADCVAFVNGVRCNKGKHVDHMYSRLTACLEDAVRKKAKMKDLSLTSGHIKNSLFCVLSVQIDGPRFASQNKEKLDTAVRDWGFRWTPDTVFSRRVVTLCADDIAARLMVKTETDALKSAKKGTSRSRTVNLPKYDPAGDAGKPNTQAMLFLAEGDSAKTLAMAGRAVVGSKIMGTYCLKGKSLNVRDVKLAAVMKHEIYTNIARILGLVYGKVYRDAADLKSLNYNCLVLMADQDHDGDHIVGLIVNWIETMWPSLLKLRPDFIKRFATPIVIARRKAKAKAADFPDKEVQFLSQPTFKRWLEANPERSSAYAFQYYKGLGGHSSKLGRTYFASCDEHMVTLKYAGKSDHEALRNFFDKKRADKRKKMLEEDYDADSSVDYSASAVSMSHFLMNGTLHYSRDDNIRHLPGIDGLTRTKRKLLWSFRKQLRPGVMTKLQTLAMQGARDSHYHHGDASLYSTTAQMAQQHVGANNINLLLCDAQVGSRHAARKVFAAPRYLFTGLDPIIDKFIRREDDPILTYFIEDGKYMVEPTAFAPVVPYDLINGISGVSTAWSTEIPSFNPVEVIDVFRARVRGDADWRERADCMLPWFDGFTGTIEATDKSYITTGLYYVEDTEKCIKIVISDLPVGTWVHDFTTTLDGLLESKGGWISRYTTDNTDTRVRITLECDPARFYELFGKERTDPFAPDARGYVNTADAVILDQAAETYATGQRRYPQLEKDLGLVSIKNWTIMHRFNAEMDVVRHELMSDFVDAYYAFRFPLYAARLEFMARDTQRLACILENKIRFIREVVEGTIKPRLYATKEEWWIDLNLAGYVRDKDPRILPHDPKTMSDLPQLADDKDDSDDTELPTFKYLTSMAISSLTRGFADKMEKEYETLRGKIAAIDAMTPASAWLSDLDELEDAYQVFLKARAKSNKVDAPKLVKGAKKAKRRKRQVPLDLE